MDGEQVGANIRVGVLVLGIAVAGAFAWALVDTSQSGSTRAWAVCSLSCLAAYIVDAAHLCLQPGSYDSEAVSLAVVVAVPTAFCACVGILIGEVTATRRR